MDILATLNQNWVLSAISIGVSIIGFFITNNRITKTNKIEKQRQTQKLGNDSKGYQAGGDIGNIG